MENLSSIDRGTDWNGFDRWSVRWLHDFLNRDIEFPGDYLSDMPAASFALAKPHSHSKNSLEVIHGMITFVNFLNYLFLGNIFTTTNYFHTSFYPESSVSQVGRQILFIDLSAILCTITEACIPTFP